MPNTLDKEALEAAFPHLLNFRKWTRTTDELTDHDLLVTANHIVSDVLAALGVRVVVEKDTCDYCIAHSCGERIVIWEEDEEDED
jgi:hypothetical protein